MRLYLIRHGRQSSRLCNVDVNLSKEGERQAQLLGKRLKTWGIQAVYSSDFQRAVETAKSANGFWGVPHIVRPELREISFGVMEGLSDDAITRRFGAFQKEQEKMEADLPYPGGECSKDVIRRATPLFLEMAGSGLKRVVAVTHGGVIRSMVASFLHMDPAKSRLLGSSLENCSITEVVFHGSGHYFTVERFNDYAHLEGHPELLRSSWREEEEGIDL